MLILMSNSLEKSSESLLITLDNCNLDKTAEKHAIMKDINIAIRCSY